MHSDLQYSPLPKLSAALSVEKMSHVKNEQRESAFGASQSYPMTAGTEGAGVWGNLFNEHQGIFPFTLLSLLI